MAAQKLRPYAELGRILETLRSDQFSSARAMFSKARFSFSYSAYAKFEKGTALPSVGVLVELCKFLKKNPVQAIYSWAKVQMPSAELKKLFANAPTEEESASSTSETKPPSFENTWVLGPRDLDMFGKTPWLWELCTLLSMVHPGDVKFSDLKLHDNLSSKELIEEKIQPWIKAGFVLISNQGLKLKHPHLHMPKAPEWNDVGKNNIQRATHALLESITRTKLDKNLSYRGLIHRPLTKEQVTKWVQKLKHFESQFIEDEYMTSEETYGLVALLGPRSLKKP